MKNQGEIYTDIKEEVLKDAPEIRQKFLDHFDHEIEQFIINMSKAFVSWQNLDSQIGQDRKKAYVVALVYNAINSHIISMKFFVAGYAVPSGNLHRQVIESIAISILCSHKSLNVLDRYMDNQYSTTKALKDLNKHASTLNLNKAAMRTFAQSIKFYDLYSHPTMMALSNIISFRGDVSYLGACFDKEKLKEYKKEINGKVSLAAVFPNFIEGISAELSRW